MAAAATVAMQRNLAVLCVDTCSLLDVLRSPLRGDGARTIAAADALAKAQSAGQLTLFMAPSITPELARNVAIVKRELEQHLTRVDDDVHRAADCLGQCGSCIAVVSLKGSSLQTQLEGRFDRLVNACDILDADDGAKGQAIDRAVNQRRPSTKGSVLDANIIEHYLALGRELKRLGFGRPFVFVSSNTKDYCEAGALHADLSADFQALSLEYTSTLPWAKKALGLR